MRERLNGLVMRGSTFYYTFQRFSTGQSYLLKLKKRGEDISKYQVSYVWGGGAVEMSSKEFLKRAPRLIAEQKAARSLLPRRGHLRVNKKVETIISRGPKVKAVKPRARVPRRVRKIEDPMAVASIE